MWTWYNIINNSVIIIEKDDISFGETESLIHSEFSIKDNKFSFDIIKSRESSKKYYNEKYIDEIYESLKIKTEEQFIKKTPHRDVK